MNDTKDIKSANTATRKKYSTPKLKQYGDLRNLSKGNLAYAAEEGAYREMNPPSGQ